MGYLAKLAGSYQLIHLTNRRRLVLQFLDHDAREAIRGALQAQLGSDTLALTTPSVPTPQGKATEAVDWDGGRYIANQLRRRVASNLRLLAAFD